MSIYIQGIDIQPDDAMTIVVYSDKSYCAMVGNCYFKSGPVIQVPPHGDLIDRSEIIEDHNLGTVCKNCKRDARDCRYEMIHTTMDFCEWIEDANTVIPGDKEATP